jgi:predicted dehydrogenase
VVAIAASTLESAETKARRLNIDRAYSSYEELLADRTIEVVHVCTPNYLHYAVVMAAIRSNKHVICDKPLALTSVEAKELRDYARAAGVVNAVAFNYRFCPMVEQARAMVAGGEIGNVRFVHGHYMQDWLLYETDFSWRLEADKGGASSSVGDIGTHWCDTALFIAGLKFERVLASLNTMVQVRKKPTGSNDSLAVDRFQEHTENYVITSDDLGSIMLEFEGGARGVFLVGQVCPGHKNDLKIELNGSQASLRWEQERSDELWVGRRDRPNMQLARDPALLTDSARRHASLPGGYGEGWADSFKNLMSSVYSFIAEDGNPDADRDKIDFPTFDDGYLANCVVDAIIRSNIDRSRWTRVEY